MDAISSHSLGSMFDTTKHSSEVKAASPHKSTTNDKTNSLEKVTTIVDDLNHSLNQLNTTLRFSVDNESNVFYVAVIDTKTKEILRRFPAEELPNSTTILHKPSGVFLNTKG